MSDTTAESVLSHHEKVAKLTAEFINALANVDGSPAIRSRSLLSNDLGALLVHSPDPTAGHYIETRSPHGTWTCLDLGCGSAPHKPLLERAGARWTGCDLQGSRDPATLARNGSTLDGQIIEYDGTTLPFPDESFDAVWSWQSLEHVHHPEATFSEISRVLRPGGAFFGSTSFLEPYHAQSTFSYTPYGFKLICERHDLTLVEIAPSLDGLSYFIKRLAIILGLDDGKQIQEAFNAQSPLAVIDDLLRQHGREGEFVHILAQICGTFRFKAIHIN